ncbi:MAG: GGDEF domain-containing protein [Bermanella sp.]
MQYAPRLIDQIVDLTALRDMDLLEFSLLKTLNKSLRPTQLKLLKFDCNFNPLRVIEFQDGECKVSAELIHIQQEIQTAVQHMGRCGAMDYTTPYVEGFITLYCLKRTEARSTYLILMLQDRLPDIDAYLVSGLLQVHRNFFELLEESQLDQLTGLSNRKTFDETITKVYDLIYPRNSTQPGNKRSEKTPKYWLAMLDIDHFKKVNDNFGHLYGDEVLLLIAQIIKGCFREDDMVFRFGGEEFVVILRSEDRTTCQVALERLREKIANYEFPRVGSVTISIGVTELISDTFHVTLMDYADKALYHSKGSGRNQTTFFEDLVTSGKAKEQEINEGGVHFL